MQKMIADALKEEVYKNGLITMGDCDKQAYVDYDRLAKAVVYKLQEKGYL